MLQAVFHSSISEIDPSLWDGLFACDNPFVQHAFLLALEESACVSAATGWQPQHMVLYRRDKAVAVLPLYLKSHSYGEFVFDWGWAQAYERNGLSYYPKLLTAIPFIPSSGPRAGFAGDQDRAELTAALLEHVQEHARQLGCSGWHLLFPEPDLVAHLQGIAKPELLCRRDLQFHWFNRNYQCFDDYLSVLRSSRRKNLKRERRKVAEQGLVLQRKTAHEITGQDWAAFYRCYTRTYLKRSGHAGYLNREFFQRLLELMREQLMLVVAKRDDEVVASSLFLFDKQRLYGRYWGALEDIRFMHFEACFYQGIEFCIENGISEFDPGTQGEHKLLRGFEPHETCSFHWIADPRFRGAIEDFLKTERKATRDYSDRASEFLPYKNEINTNSQ